jgi:hypothetical protein
MAPSTTGLDADETDRHPTALVVVAFAGHRPASVTSARMSGERLGVGRVCPRCGVRADTLGTVCPACRRPYAGRGLLELTPLFLIPAAALVGLAIWLLFTNLVAGIIVAATAFALLVVAIAVTNALHQRPPRV